MVNVKAKFVWMAIIIASMLVFLQLSFAFAAEAGGQGLPLLTVLLINEFGFVICCIGAGTAVSTIKESGWRNNLVVGIVMCAIFAIGFLITLIKMYPGGGT